MLIAFVLVLFLSYVINYIIDPYIGHVIAVVPILYRPPILLERRIIHGR